MIVAGRKLEDITIQTFIERCEFLIEEEQNKINPDNTLIDILCNSVRLARQYIDEIKVILNK